LQYTFAKATHLLRFVFRFGPRRRPPEPFRKERPAKGRGTTAQNPLDRILAARASALEREAGDYIENGGISHF